METAASTPAVVKSYQVWRPEWWGGLLSALEFWKYNPKEIGIWNLSSAVTLVQIAGLNAVFSKLLPSMSWATVWSAVKAATAKVLTVTVAAVVTLFELVFN